MGLSLRLTRFATDSERSYQAGRLDRVLIVSNRLPATVHVDGRTVRLSPSSGGLATGLRRLHAGSSRPWIGWSGIGIRLPRATQRQVDAQLARAGARGVALEEGEVAAYYHRFANGFLWPLLHGAKPDGPVEPGDWRTYRSVNARFARDVLDELRPDDRVWIHDYHLLLLSRMLRRRRPDAPIGFFLHTPFPEPSGLVSLPHWAALLDGLLGADVVGFQTRADVERFAEAVRVVLGRRVALASGTGMVEDRGRPVGLFFSPMSVDVDRLSRLATETRTRERSAAVRGDRGPLFVGVDRLDPTKGIPERLEAFGRLLEARPELRGQARLIQLAVPSREEVPSYRAVRARVESMVEQLNARFTVGTHTPVSYTYGTLPEPELLALYRAADVMLVTSLRDGMNLVAKEFVASRTDEQGVLVLSRWAGAAAELSAALLVDPTQPGELTRAYAAALDMSEAERRVRMRRLRARLAAHDVHRWSRECLGQLDEQVRRSRGGVRYPC
jgi:trehalose 6-phosphate synthase/phosphatase